MPSLRSSTESRAISPGSRTPFPLPQAGSVSSTVTAFRTRSEREQTVARSIRTLSMPNSSRLPQSAPVNRTRVDSDVNIVLRSISNRCQP